MKFQAKFKKVSGVQDSMGDKYTDVALRLFLRPDPGKQEETTAYVSMHLMELLYNTKNVIVNISPDDEGEVNPSPERNVDFEEEIVSDLDDILVIDGATASIPR